MRGWERFRPGQDKFTLDRIAAEQQARLLMFRLEDLDRVWTSSPASAQKIETFSPKLRDIACALAVPLLGDEHLFPGPASAKAG
jgi:hypothetical protein